jgi:hypothetical protein
MRRPEPKGGALLVCALPLPMAWSSRIEIRSPARHAAVAHVRVTVAVTRPSRMRSVVVLPEPFGPQRTDHAHRLDLEADFIDSADPA